MAQTGHTVSAAKGGNRRIQHSQPLFHCGRHIGKGTRLARRKPAAPFGFEFIQISRSWTRVAWQGGGSFRLKLALVNQTFKASVLRAHFGIEFNTLFALANMPIQRFGSTLISKGQFQTYMSLLKSQHRDDNLAHVMCRSLVSVDWQGQLSDCDFNQQLGLPTPPRGANQAPLHLRDLLAQGLDDHPIRVADHCFGCTAGSGSSCGGALQGAAA